MSKEENRGAHWRAKVLDGNAPTPWKSNTEWAMNKRNMQDIFVSTASTLGIQSCVLPWESSPECRVGNVNKTLWMYLMICKWKKIAFLNDNTDHTNGFMGISCVVIPHEKVAEFNQGPFQVSVSSYHKTARKQWRVAGFFERHNAEAVIMQYDGKLRDQLRLQQSRAGGRKTRTSTLTHLASVAANMPALESLKSVFPTLVTVFMSQDQLKIN